MSVRRVGVNNAAPQDRNIINFGLNEKRAKKKSKSLNVGK